jgi:hypothetical protein
VGDNMVDGTGREVRPERADMPGLRRRDGKNPLSAAHRLL